MTAKIHRPFQCPECGSTEIEGGPITIEHPTAWQEDCNCLVCHAQWEDYYAYTDYLLISSGDGSKPEIIPAEDESQD